MATDHKLRFVHLSDIHFSNKAVNVGFNPDRVLREAVVADIKKQRQKLGPMTAILVSGDIAYAGKKDEYEDRYSPEQKGNDSGQLHSYREIGKQFHAPPRM